MLVTPVPFFFGGGGPGHFLEAFVVTHLPYSIPKPEEPCRFLLLSGLVDISKAAHNPGTGRSENLQPKTPNPKRSLKGSVSLKGVVK